MSRAVAAFLGRGGLLVMLAFVVFDLWRLNGVQAQNAELSPAKLGSLLEPSPSKVPAGLPRMITVLYGADPKEMERRKLYPPDTVTALHLQAAGEWMGFEFTFLDVTSKLPPVLAPDTSAALLIDGTLKVPFTKELAVAQWIVQAKEAGVPIILIGDIPLSADEPATLLQRSLGLRGTLQSVYQPQNCRIALADTEVMRGEMALKPSQSGFLALQAPEGSTVWLSVAAEDAKGATQVFDAAFKAPWGAALLDPYLFRQFGPQHMSQLFDPFVFWAKALPRDPWPIPDPTTRDGCRLFFSHIDGDGFTDATTVKEGAFCGEIVRERVLEAYPIPITISLITAEMQGYMVLNDKLMQKTYDERIAKEVYLKEARKILTHPRVQAASHSFSHPFMWIEGDDDPVTLAKKEFNLKLKPEAKYPSIKPASEVTLSIDWINQNVLKGSGNSVELMLWTGNCRPPGAALQAASALGVECLNGGNTFQSKRWPGRAGVAPRCTMMDGELQLYAPNQNEMYYTDNWRSTFLGGFAAVRETFEMTNRPRRLKPVNIYYHFYSASRGDALSALLTIHDWAMGQPLQACTAMEYARLLRDSRTVQIRPLQAKQWSISLRGKCRTVRLPITAGYPTLTAASSVMGWCDFEGQRYLHIAPNTSTLTLAVQQSAPVRPSLASSELEVAAFEATDQTITLSVKGWKPGRLALRLPGGSASWRLMINGQAANPLPPPADTEADLTWLQIKPEDAVTASQM